MRPFSFGVAVLAAAMLSACGGGGGGGGGGSSFDGFSPTHQALPSSGGPQDFRDGAAVAWLHWNGDALADLAVGAPNASGVAGTVAGVGAVHLYTQNVGGTFTLARTFAPTQWSGVTAAVQMNFGAAVAAADLDGDGRDDLVIGAPGDAVGTDLAAGRVYAVFNDVSQVDTLAGPFAQPTNVEAGAGYGSVIVAGRLNNDGSEDVAVAAPGATVASNAGAGAVYGLMGAASAAFGTLTTAAVVSPSPAEDGAFGASLAIGAVNSDLAADLVVGEPGAALGSGGAVRVFAGNGGALPTFTAFQALSTNEAGSLVDLGASVAVADVDDDGDLDVIAGAPFGDVGIDGSEGYVLVFLNTNPGTGAFTALAPLIDRTQESGAEFGATLAVGDLDGDGIPDLVVAAPAATAAAVFGAGTVTAFIGEGNGLFGQPTADDVLRATSPVEDAFFGSALALGDDDGDGTVDLLAVGAPGPTDALQAGSAEVIPKN
jgi:hypothetical protein